MLCTSLTESTGQVDGCDFALGITLLAHVAELGRQNSTVHARWSGATVDLLSFCSLRRVLSERLPIRALCCIVPPVLLLKLSMSCCPAAGPQSLSVDLAAAYQLLAARMCAGAAAGVRGAAPAAETPLARSLLAIKDPQELNKK
jgi:hypothetical protein